MLESASERLSAKGGPHYGSPDKRPAARLETLRLAGEEAVPFTSGILIGIGETRQERIEALLALRDAHDAHGHIQEIIVQNFRAKPGTRMADAPEPSLDELLWTIAAARILFGPEANIQAPPNLSPGALPQLVAAGINDWGGVSPVTQDYVNPEAPWPHLDALARETAGAGKTLAERLTIYPSYALAGERWLDSSLRERVLKTIDSEGYPRTDAWVTGAGEPPPEDRVPAPAVVAPGIERLLARAEAGEGLGEEELVRLFQARGGAFDAVCAAADALRARVSGSQVSYVVNRNINYTNVCYFRCQFCAFSKGKLSENLRGRPYDLPLDEIVRRVREAWETGRNRGLPAGRHPSRLHGRDLSCDLPRHQGGGARDPRPCLLAAGDLAGGGDAGPDRARLPFGATGGRVGFSARHRRRNPRRRSARRHLPRQDRDRPVALRDGGGAWAGAAQHRHDHVRPCRRATSLGAPPPARARLAGANGWLHRVRAASLRRDGGADLSQGPRQAGADLARGPADAFGGAARAAPGYPQHPDFVGENGAQGGRGLPQAPGPTISAAR